MIKPQYRNQEIDPLLFSLPGLESKIIGAACAMDYQNSNNCLLSCVTVSIVVQ